VKRSKFIYSLAGAAALTATAFTTPGYATGATAEGTAGACSLGTESITATGGDTGSMVTATKPPSQDSGTTAGIFQPGQVRLASNFIHEPNIAGMDVSGWVIQGDTLYYSSYPTNDPAQKILRRIGGGWRNYTALEISQYDEGPSGAGHRSSAYGLRSDGTLLRWDMQGETWRSTGSATGFGSVKSMALISKTRTYDTFLANLSGGALYTIRIPATAPMKPVVKKVRTSTWQGFEKLIASKCGVNGTLLLAIDKDTKAGYLYAVSHANGAATVINGLGKVTGTFPNAVNFRWGVVSELDPLNGE